MARKTRAPKSQVERYTCDGVTRFKGDKIGTPIPYHFKQGKSRDTYEMPKAVSRGKATER